MFTVLLVGRAYTVFSDERIDEERSDELIDNSRRYRPADSRGYTEAVHDLEEGKVEGLIAM